MKLKGPMKMKISDMNQIVLELAGLKTMSEDPGVIYDKGCERKPEIMNSDQGSHFTSKRYLELLESQDVRVSMDGKGQALDNARTERFFRSLKYSESGIDHAVV